MNIAPTVGNSVDAPPEANNMNTKSGKTDGETERLEKATVSGGSGNPFHVLKPTRKMRKYNNRFYPEFKTPKRIRKRFLRAARRIYGPQKSNLDGSPEYCSGMDESHGKACKAAETCT